VAEQLSSLATVEVGVIDVADHAPRMLVNAPIADAITGNVNENATLTFGVETAIGHRRLSQAARSVADVTGTACQAAIRHRLACWREELESRKPAMSLKRGKIAPYALSIGAKINDLG